MFARALVVTALGVGAALIAIGVIVAPAILVGGALVGAAGGTWALIRLREIAPGDTAAKARAARRGGLAVAAVAAGGWLAMAGSVVLLGTAATPLLLLPPVAAAITAWRWRRSGTDDGTSPTLRRAVEARLVSFAQTDEDPAGRRSGRRGGPAAITETASPPIPLPKNLSTPQLCLAWQHTYFALADLPAGPPRADLVTLRAWLLDEIERRDPAAFSRWLDAGARAGSNPGRYIDGDR